MGRGIALLFHDHGTRSGEWSAARPGRTLPPGKTRYPLYRRLGGSQGRSGQAENLAPAGIWSTDRPGLVGRYTDWATKLKLSPLTVHNPRLLLSVLPDITPWEDIFTSWGWPIVRYVGGVKQRKKPQPTFCVIVKFWLHLDMHIWAHSWTQRMLTHWGRGF